MEQVSSKLNRAYKILKLIYIPVIIGTAYFVSTNWYQVSLIRGDSMSPAYHNMQLVLIDRHCGLYTYGDVVTFRCEKLDAVLVKRIVACPGDQVIIENGTLYVNDAVSQVFSEPFIFEYSGIADDRVALGENQYFVIGDNLEESRDSRYVKVGLVNREDILGKMVPCIDRN
ncbi:MAG: signal peptidase I [Lachnospiraceae bacterium]|nr:signal peptidase I [Lachnospiraceae bacterium]